MFSIDPSLLPSLRTRKALLVIDAQNDFLSEDGALPVNTAFNLPERISKLADGFRQGGGEIIWVKTLFESSRSAEDEQISTSGRSSASTEPAHGRRPRNSPSTTGTTWAPEAFLTLGPGAQPWCVREGTEGAELHPDLKRSVAHRDQVIVKTFYSAFKSLQLVQLLRIKLVTELFICGSDISVGVMATAIDAASYGYNITLVDDCCGSHGMMQHRTAMRQISNTTGCNKLHADQVLESMNAGQSKSSVSVTDGVITVGPPSVGHLRDTQDDFTSSSSLSDMQLSLEKLSLSDGTAAHKCKPPPTRVKLRTKRLFWMGHRGRRSDTKAEQGARSHAGSGIATARNNPTPQKSIKLAPNLAVEAPDLLRLSHKERNNSKGVEGTMINSTIVSANMGESEPLCEGDTKVLYDVLPEPLVKDIFGRIQNEVDWKRMSHQGGEVPRLVAVQGQVDEDGSMPVYRHPADESPPLLPFTPTVDQVRRVIETKLGHPLNHVLIQLYRHGNDYISEHSDKTLDIAKGSFIANVSLGAERTMTLRTKRQPKQQDTATQEPEPDPLKRQVQRARLPHNSLCQMGLATNMRWLHAIRQDRRLARDKIPAELAYDGARISLTFRRIGTFLDRENKHIWGQGATAKTKKDARAVLNGQSPEAIEMLRAFGRENQSSDFDWDAHYGTGFDVLHITAAPRLFLSPDPVVNLRVQMMLAEFGISYAQSAGASLAVTKYVSDKVSIKLIDTDDRKTTVEGQRDIMTHLNSAYGQPGLCTPDSSSSYETLDGDIEIMDEWQSSESAESAKLLEARLRNETPFIHGRSLGLGDFALWPLLHVMMPTLSDTDKSGLPKLMAYYERVYARETVSKMLETWAQPNTK
ncbi:hypothetical protein F5Y18DRAFT_418787 [Xylariaceae sp. FL1019]|nr:hypothetical protein F5Y18DRAFT_418787 [Xylariaceae sp. FL1019]